METAGDKKWSAEEPKEEVELQMSSQPSTAPAKAKATGKKQKKSETDNGCKPKEGKPQDTETPGQTRRKVPIPPIPEYLPPVNLIHRDVLRAWCQKKRVSSKGQKLDAYKRLLARAFPEQMLELRNVPDSAKDARLKTAHKKMKTEPGEESEVTVPLEMVPVPEEQIPALIDPPMLYEEVSTTVVTTPATEAVLASWARIASNAKKYEAVPADASSSSEVKGEMWCVVHGTSLPGNSRGWVRLQFHAGQAWVPDKKGKAIALFLLPACTFPPPHLEDNMLCPKCVHKNKILTKSLEG
ncbi:developmental pluripotency-associated protein 4 isoform 1 [Mus musculus]|uniref:Developmental pluripotency-associated protein 4 n=1 Tax=Mus musculus TaxID=10090 RepID=DPPA4_MOUSE|nr:developmental pluripotency-associated protein 4 isoform 1 [Mus musculus]Q8CCG4.2 RecName: Full=Developmental pluripotency-associated protein 4; AltName: Full=Embryonic stem cell-associated transcript 15-1 protein; Short=ECAT15-1 [Mus musculus]EDK98091.1 developmental pluripotency associated 4 [Mus musculus]|eukprot:NP_082886.2 developmental pluripotency-associated protein 4 isoform 1 [Mus musculus]